MSTQLIQSHKTEARDIGCDWVPSEPTLQYLNQIFTALGFPRTQIIPIVTQQVTSETSHSLLFFPIKPDLLTKRITPLPNHIVPLHPSSYPMLAAIQLLIAAGKLPTYYLQDLPKDTRALQFVSDQNLININNHFSNHRNEFQPFLTCHFAIFTSDGLQMLSQCQDHQGVASKESLVESLISQEIPYLHYSIVFE